MLRPKWYEHIVLAFDKQRRKRNLLERLLWASDTHPFVKHATVTLSKSELAQEAIILGLLSNLRRLEISIEPGSWVNGTFMIHDDHDEVLSAIPSRFPLLEELRCGYHTIADDDFLESLGDYELPPRLELLKLQLHDSSPLARTLPPSPRLEINIHRPDESPPQVGLHWRTLTHLSVKPGLTNAWAKWLLTSATASVSHFRPASASSAYEFHCVAQVRDARMFPLRTLSLSAMVYDNAAEIFATRIDFAEKMLDVLRSSELRHLELRFGALPWRSFGTMLLEHLASLTLDFECDVFSEVSATKQLLSIPLPELIGPNFQQLFVDIVGSLVAGAPNLVVLSVNASDLSCADMHEARARTRLSKWELARHHSQVYDLILLVQETRVLDFRTWWSPHMDASVRWTRSRPDELFACDVWCYFSALD